MAGPVKSDTLTCVVGNSNYAHITKLLLRYCLKVTVHL